MKAFDKNNWDVSRIFLAYLTFLGNATKVGIALDMRPEVVEVLAAAEDWPAKLKVYLGLRHEEALPEPDTGIRRTATYIAAFQLRDIIQALIRYAHQNFTRETLVDWFSPRDYHTNKPRFNPNLLLALCRAFSVVTRILNREISAGEVDPEEATVREGVTIREAIGKAHRAMDLLPGVDTVAVARASLAKWTPAPPANDHTK